MSKIPWPDFFFQKLSSRLEWDFAHLSTHQNLDFVINAVRKVFIQFLDNFSSQGPEQTIVS